MAHVALGRILGRLDRPKRQATHEMVAAVLREAITTGELRANQPLPQDEIASQLRVSHIPVREALRPLQSEGLVDYQPNRGAMVSALNADEIREIYQIRSILETAAIRQAAPRLTPDVLERASVILDEGERTTDPRAWGALDVDFHELVYDLEDRPRLKELINGLLQRVDRYWLSYGLMLQYRAIFEREHRELLQALSLHEAGRAEEILGAHLTGACDHLVQQLGNLERSGKLATAG
jgi:DNA-binding GntR family transcriptional regulator